MANPRYYPQPERQSGRSRKLGELASLLQLGQASQAPMLEQQALQQREQAGRQDMMMQFMQMMQQQQEARQRAELGRGQLGLQERELQQRGQDVAGRQSLGEMNALTELARSGDANALRALGMRIPEYGQAQDMIRREEEAKRAAAMPDALRASVSGQATPSAIPQGFWPSLLSAGVLDNLQQVPPAIKSVQQWMNEPQLPAPSIGQPLPTSIMQFLMSRSKQ